MSDAPNRMSARSNEPRSRKRLTRERKEKAMTFGRKVRAYAVHVYTASGVIFAFLAVAELMARAPNPRWVFLWLLIAGLIDATDGPLARRWEVKKRAARIGGRTIDDIVDYLTFTFIPLLLIWRMDWLPAAGGVWVALAMVASLFGFANTAAKQEDDGFFLGFPSYWNMVAYYVGLWAAPAYAPGGPWASVALIAGLAALTVLPVRFIYPNRAPKPWRRVVIIGAALWLVLLVALLPSYPTVPVWVMALSAVYPLFYFALSVYLDRFGAARQRSAGAS